jgi:hypothetical protein
MILKFAALTCAFYLGISVLIQAALFGVAIWKGSVGIFLSRWMWGAVFAVIWLASFSLAWHFFFSGARARLSTFP